MTKILPHMNQHYSMHQSCIPCNWQFKINSAAPWLSFASEYRLLHGLNACKAAWCVEANYVYTMKIQPCPNICWNIYINSISFLLGWRNTYASNYWVRSSMQPEVPKQETLKRSKVRTWTNKPYKGIQKGGNLIAKSFVMSKSSPRAYLIIPGGNAQLPEWDHLDRRKVGLPVTKSNYRHSSSSNHDQIRHGGQHTGIVLMAEPCWNGSSFVEGTIATKLSDSKLIWCAESDKFWNSHPSGTEEYKVGCALSGLQSETTVACFKSTHIKTL